MRYTRPNFIEIPEMNLSHKIHMLRVELAEVIAGNWVPISGTLIPSQRRVELDNAINRLELQQKEEKIHEMDY